MLCQYIYYLIHILIIFSNPLFLCDLWMMDKWLLPEPWSESARLAEHMLCTWLVSCIWEEFFLSLELHDHDTWRHLFHPIYYILSVMCNLSCSLYSFGFWEKIRETERIEMGNLGFALGFHKGKEVSMIFDCETRDL